jgi:hypothetical protein
LIRDPRQNVPQQGFHTRGYTRLFNPGLAGSPQHDRHTYEYHTFVQGVELQ